MDLPQPDPDQAEASERLAAVIRDEIRTRGPMDFARWMQLALYAPGLGYYSAGSTKFGAGGDFITAPELGPVFAQCVARACAPVLRATSGDWVELGAGSGAFAVDVLIALQELDALPRRYLIVETSAELRARQARNIAARVPALAGRVRWLDSPQGEPWAGVLFSNEVVDALPVRRFVRHEGGRVMALAVGLDTQDRFVELEVDGDPALVESVRRLHAESGSAWPHPYRSEVLPQLTAWFDAVAGQLARGLVLFVDYGYPRQEYYRPERVDGTLVCHYRHRGHGDPYLNVGLQDITAFVDFTALAEAGTEADFALAGYASQAQFLFASGIAEIVDATRDLPELERQRVVQAVKRLTLPGDMGERFKAIAFARGIDKVELGISAVDQSHRL